MTVDRIQLAVALRTIVDDVRDAAELAHRLCAACLTALPVDGVGLSLMGGNFFAGRAVLGASDKIGHHLEDLQFTLGEGPCVSAFHDGQPVLVPDLYATAVRSRWPMFIDGAQNTGARALFAFPLQIGAINFGAMDCYRIRAGPFAEVTEALVVAEAITMALLLAQSHDSQQEDNSRLADLAMSHHTQVHQATGMVAAQLDISTEEALVRLRAYAYRHGKTLDEVGSDIVGRRLRLTDDTEGSPGQGEPA